MHFYPAERLIGLLIAALAVVDASLVAIKGQAVDWAGYIPLALIGMTVIGLGQAYRRGGRSQEIGLATTAAGLYILFTLAASVLNYLLLPVGDLRLDPQLARIDAMLGYSWPGFVEWVAQYPLMGSILRYVYMSSLVQLLAVLILLGFMGRREQLHQFLLVGTVGASAAIGIWAMAPSMGPSVLYEIPADIQSRLGMVVGNGYGAELRSLAANGPDIISPADTLGLIAFPSFHTVMACLAVWFTWPIKRIRFLFLAINVAMLPAILAHGGHHLMDVLGGLALFAISLVLSKQLLASISRQPVASG